MTIELTKQQVGLLTYSLGIATASAKSVKERLELIRLTNAVHKNNPDWIPVSESAVAAILDRQ